MSLRFLLAGRVQAVKMRRYIESAGRHFRVSGFTINTAGGDVYGEAAIAPGDAATQLDNFERWLHGEWHPREYTDLKPTPVGTAYPELARVTAVVIDRRADAAALALPAEFAEFTMVRDDERARILEETRLRPSPLVPSVDARGWPREDDS